MAKDPIITHIPAQAEWYIVHPIFGVDGYRECLFDPIIAWAIVTDPDFVLDSRAIPITADRSKSDEHNYYLKRPDGVILQSGVRSWRTEEDFLEMLNQEFAEK